MKLFVQEYHRDAEVYVYGIDGDDHTEDFFDKYFSDCKEIRRTTAREKGKFGSNAPYLIRTIGEYELLANTLTVIQSALDAVADAIDSGYSTADDFRFDEQCFII